VSREPRPVRSARAAAAATAVDILH
jgi:hypothetical protein